MGFLSRRPRGSGDPVVDASRELDEVGGLVHTDLRRARRRLAKASRRYRVLLGEGGPLRHRFVEVALLLLAGEADAKAGPHGQSGPPVPFTLGDLPSVARIP